MTWCNRSLFTAPFYYGLCTTEAIYQKELRKLKVSKVEAPSFIANDQSQGTAHFFECDGKTAVLVCIKVENRTGIEVAGLLVHEAVHVWQEVREMVGEKNPSSEFEAYAIQHISQQLMWEFEQQTKSASNQ